MGDYTTVATATQVFTALVLLVYGTACTLLGGRVGYWRGFDTGADEVRRAHAEKMGRLLREVRSQRAHLLRLTHEGARAPLGELGYSERDRLLTAQETVLREACLNVGYEGAACILLAEKRWGAYDAQTHTWARDPQPWTLLSGKP